MKPTRQIKSFRLDHHGIVAGVLEDLGVAETVGEIVGEYGNEKLSVGKAICALVINGLGFKDKALSLTPEFFSELPIET